MQKHTMKIVTIISVFLLAAFLLAACSGGGVLLDIGAFLVHTIGRI